MKTPSSSSPTQSEAVRPRTGNFAVYILTCADGTLYTGYTTDIENRIRVHNEGKAGAKYTRTRRPVALAYMERFATKSEALKREHAIKKLSKTGKTALIRSVHIRSTS